MGANLSGRRPLTLRWLIDAKDAATRSAVISMVRPVSSDTAVAATRADPRAKPSTSSGPPHQRRGPYTRATPSISAEATLCKLVVQVVSNELMMHSLGWWSLLRCVLGFLGPDSMGAHHFGDPVACTRDSSEELPLLPYC